MQFSRFVRTRSVDSGIAVVVTGTERAPGYRTGRVAGVDREARCAFRRVALLVGHENRRGPGHVQRVQWP